MIEVWVGIFAQGVGTPLRKLKTEMGRDSLGGSEREKSLGDHGREVCDRSMRWKLARMVRKRRRRVFGYLVSGGGEMTSV